MKPIVKMGYQINRGVISLNGVAVGSLDKRGNYRITDGQRVRVGTVADLIQGDVVGKTLVGGPAGILRVGRYACDVRDGVVHFSGKPIGTVDAEGNYAVKMLERTAKGKLSQARGVVLIRPTQSRKTGASARIEIGGRDFTAIDGVIFESGEAIGWLQADGRFRGVTREGDHFEGSLNNLKAAAYFRFVEAAAPCR